MTLRSVWSLCELLDCGAAAGLGGRALSAAALRNWPHGGPKHNGERARQRQKHRGNWKFLFHRHPPGDVSFILRTHPFGFLAHKNGGRSQRFDEGKSFSAGRGQRLLLFPGLAAVFGREAATIGGDNGGVQRIAGLDAVQSAAASGEATRCQCSPSVVRRITPARPAIQATLSDGAAPASRSLVTPLDCDLPGPPLVRGALDSSSGAQTPERAAVGRSQHDRRAASQARSDPAIPRAAKACGGRFSADFASAPLAEAEAGAGAAAGAAVAAAPPAAPPAFGAGRGAPVAEDVAEAAAGDSSVTASPTEFCAGAGTGATAPCKFPRAVARQRRYRLARRTAAESAARSLLGRFSSPAAAPMRATSVVASSGADAASREAAAGGAGTSAFASSDSSRRRRRLTALAFCAVTAGSSRGAAPGAARSTAPQPPRFLPLAPANAKWSADARRGQLFLLLAERGSDSTAAIPAAAARRPKRSTSASPSGSSLLTVSTARIFWQRAHPAKCSSQCAVSAASRLWSAYAASNPASGHVSIARRPVGRPKRFGKQPGQRAVGIALLLDVTHLSVLTGALLYFYSADPFRRSAHPSSERSAQVFLRAPLSSPLPAFPGSLERGPLERGPLERALPRSNAHRPARTKNKVRSPRATNPPGRQLQSRRWPARARRCWRSSRRMPSS